MRFVVSTPTRIVVDEPRIASLRAEDATGSFGILPRHADFVTVLSPSVIAWRTDSADAEQFVAVRGGVLTVAAGALVEVATREAVRGDDLVRLEADVVSAFRAAREAEIAERSEDAKLEVAAIRRLYRWLRPGTGDGAPTLESTRR